MPSEPTPDRVIIGDLETGESLQALYNPAKVEATIEVNFTRLTIPGLSHQILQFIHTGNLAVSFTLGFDGNSQDDVDAADGQDMRNFLHSLTLQRKSASSVASGSPPRVLLYWPNLYQIVCQLVTMKEIHDFFDPTMAPVIFAVELKVEENRQTRLFSEDVRRSGTLRTSQ